MGRSTKKSTGVRLAALVAAVLAVALAGIAVPTAPASAATVAGSLTLRPSARVAGESSVARGALPPKHARQVRLQRLIGTTWRTLTMKTSSSTGTFSFTLRTPSRTSKYRVYAPRTTIGGVVRRAVVTPTRTLTVQTQTASISAPTSLAISTTGTVTGTFRPIRVGRPVTLQRLASGSWTAVASRTQNSNGSASFSVSRASAGSTTYRVVTGAWRGAAAKATGSRTISFFQPPDSTAPGAVTDLTVTANDLSGISFSWTNPTAADLSFVELRRAVGPTPPSTSSAGEYVTDVFPPDHSATDFFIDVDTQYSYAFFAQDDAGNVGPGTSITVTSAGPPPGQVSNVTAPTVTATSVGLSWENPTDEDFAGVRIRRLAGSAPPASPTAGTLVGNAAAPATSFTDTGLSALSQYSYALFAYDDDGNFADGVPVTVTTPDGTPPGPVTALSATGVTPSSASFSWTNPTAGDFAGVRVRRAVGSTPPASPTAGTQAADVAKPGTTFTDTGLSPGTHYSYAFFAYDEARNYASAATAGATTTSASSGEWLQNRAGPEQNSWSPAETLLNTGNATSVAEEWDEAPGAPVISGTSAWVYGTDQFGGSSVRVYDLTTGALSDEFQTNGCSAGSIALTSSVVVVSCGGSYRGYSRTSGHVLLWDIDETDPGHSFQSFLLSADTLVARSTDRVAAYSLADGQRLWQQLLPSGATTLYDVAVSGTTVLVAYDDRLRALSLGTGGQLWSVTGAGSAEVVASGAWAYVHDADSVQRYAVADGEAGWSVSPEFGVYRLLAGDGDTVYVWSAVFDFGPPEPSILRALRSSDGSERWAYNVPTRVRDVAVTGDLFWLTTSQIFSQGRYSALIAVSRSTGAEVKRIEFEDNIYSSQFAVGAGKVLFSQGGSAGNPAPARLRVFGTGGVLPRITSGVLTLGRVGTPYTHQLTSVAGAGGVTWSVVGGSLPGGLSLSGAGLLSGTPTGAGTSQLTVRATAGNSRSSQLTMPLTVVASGTPAWTSAGRDGTRNPFEPGTGALDVDDAATIGPRWTTQTPGSANHFAPWNVVAVGARIYTVTPDGLLAAYDSTGTTAARAPLWTAHGDEAATFNGRVVHAGDRLLVRGTDGGLYAFDATTGTRLWRTAETTLVDDPVVVDGTVVVRTTDARLRAFSLSDGSASWGGVPSELSGITTSPASDGTRLFVVAGCALSALDPATGAELWHADMLGKLLDNCFTLEAAAPIVVGGKVYATEIGSKLVADAANGTVLKRFRVGDWDYSQPVLVGNVLLYWGDDAIAAYDTTSDRVVWKKPWVVGNGSAIPNLSAAGDLVLVTNTTGIVGIDRRNGETVWDGGTISTWTVTATVGGSRIFVATLDGVRAWGPPS